MKNMFIIYLVVITALLISNSKACDRPFFSSSGVNNNGGQKMQRFPTPRDSQGLPLSNDSPNTGRNCFTLFQILFSDWLSANTTDADQGVSGVSKDQKNCEVSKTTHCQVDHLPIIE